MTVTWTGTDDWMRYVRPAPSPHTVPLGNLVGMVTVCDECKRWTDHDGNWHRERLYPPEGKP